MNLVIDIGNTLTKIEFFSDNIVVFSKKYKIFKLNYLKKIIAQQNPEKKINAAIISSVSYYPEELIKYLKNNSINTIFFDEHTPIPLKNLYETPVSLGKDRLAAAVGANFLYPHKNVLCIDLGTCIKYDFVNENNEYLGGAISPGYKMRLKALNTFTGKLPLIEIKKINVLIGRNTEESILSGVINGISSEINDTILKYKKKYPKLKLILSGGDMKNFDNNLKISIFAFSNIVSFGLNIILEYNKQKLNS